MARRSSAEDIQPAFLSFNPFEIPPFETRERLTLIHHFPFLLQKLSEAPFDQLSMVESFVLLSFLSYVRLNPECRVTQKQICAITKACPKAVNLAVRKLEHHGSLTTRRVRYKDGSIHNHHAPGPVVISALTEIAKSYPHTGFDELSARVRRLEALEASAKAAPLLSADPPVRDTDTPQTSPGSGTEGPSVPGADKQENPSKKNSSSCANDVNEPERKPRKEEENELLGLGRERDNAVERAEQPARSPANSNANSEAKSRPSPLTTDEQGNAISKEDEEIAKIALEALQTRLFPKERLRKTFIASQVLSVARCAASLDVTRDDKLQALIDSIEGAFVVSKEIDPTESFIWGSLGGDWTKIRANFARSVRRGRELREARERDLARKEREKAESERQKPTAPSAVPDDFNGAGLAMKALGWG